MVMSSDIDLRDPDWLLRRIHKFRQEVQHVEREYLELRTLFVLGYTILREGWKNSRSGIPGLYQAKHRK
jgi:hypothetical protein